MTHRIRKAAAVVVALAALGACSSEVVLPPNQIIEETTFHPDLNVDLDSMTQSASGLYYQDIEVGEGPPADIGDLAVVAYAGYLANGAQFDAGEFEFFVASGQLIAGFDEAVYGMAVGGVRKAVIPPDLGYGRQGTGRIPGGAILIFDIQLRQLTPADSLP